MRPSGRALAIWIAGAVLAGAAVTVLLLHERLGLGDRVPPRFDGDRAFAWLEAQCRLGPRVPGTMAHRQALDLLEQSLHPLAPALEKREVRGKDGRGRDLLGWNLLATFPGEDPPLLLGAHWDSRPWADRDVDPSRRSLPVPGANDGASGTSVLLELARLLATVPPPRKVYLALFDLEDQGVADQAEGFCLGSRALAREIPRVPGAQAVVLDMVGARDLTLDQEAHSLRFGPNLLGTLWRLGEACHPRAFTSRPGPYLTDDHVPFLEAGWEAVDMVDLRYPFWHTTADTPDKCDPASLAAVGEVLRSFVYGRPPGS